MERTEPEANAGLGVSMSTWEPQHTGHPAWDAARCAAHLVHFARTLGLYERKHTHRAHQGCTPSAEPPAWASGPGSRKASAAELGSSQEMVRFRWKVKSGLKEAI